jgi:autophagy-related protein 101
MNCKEHHLPELELSTGLVREALQCILHTILFLRSPGAVTPRDVECEGFHLTYTRIAGNDHGRGQPQQHSQQQHSSLNTDVDQKVDDAIESFLKTLSQIGPELLSGCLTLSFFERRATSQLFGLVSHEERVV